MEDVSSCSSDGEERAVGVEEGDREITENESAAPRCARFMAVVSVATTLPRTAERVETTWPVTVLY